ncbi:hypothetical protein ACO2Q0_16470 [Phenylobacterium sp. VNQ135]|uniref:hypothetical protein n=1 Tax=Phenylobacterium sp. VNQ135 TaxID=3400922 RepID=UPI003C072FF2
MNAYSAPLTEAMNAQAVEGEVVVLGPESIAVSLTPEAAEESARRLAAAAAEARRQPKPA